MSIALLAVPGFFAPLQGLWRWFRPAATQGRPTNSGVHQRTRKDAVHSISKELHLPIIQPRHTSNIATRRPLRVLRVMEAGQPPAAVGRMVISGRMADVCAELDRLAACESKLH